MSNRLLRTCVLITFVSACRSPTPTPVVANTLPPTPAVPLVAAVDAGEPVADVSVPTVDVPGGSGPVQGPTGVLEGTVILDGPMPAPVRLEIPPTSASNPGCADAARRYGQAFDISTPGAIPGALVAVEARAPGLGAPVTRRIVVRDCDVVPRFVFAKENDPVLLSTSSRQSHLPTIVGSGASIDQLLIAGQADRVLSFPGPGTYPVRLRNLPEFVGAMIYRLRQRFIDTTDSAGHFRIAEIPVGEVSVNAWYPNAIADRRTVSIRDGQVTRVEFHIRPAPQPDPTGSNQGIRHNDGTVRTPSGQIIPQ
ncbi:MAG: carboxypeptidase-like regulatory domain-containing protein [Deltaproteobacteria bacterium]|nr:carboxypeptidase-like regulatory domain-containing protein [Deltaproteobacteria bacterium]